MIVTQTRGHDDKIAVVQPCNGRPGKVAEEVAWQRDEGAVAEVGSEKR